jgi:ribosomal protein S18 acetylase RimI-like enzyme
MRSKQTKGEDGAMTTVGDVEAADVEGVVELLNELDAYYGSPSTESVRDRADQVGAAVLDPGASARLIVARDAGLVVGMASFSLLWPAVATTRSLYLKELYVREAWRGKGMGRLLLDQLDVVARRERCSRIEFTTDVENVGAQGFYQRLGYDVHRGKVFYSREL